MERIPSDIINQPIEAQTEKPNTSTEQESITSKPEAESLVENNKIHFRAISEEEKKYLDNERNLNHIGYYIGEIHKNQTDIVFLTQGSSIPYGIILKEAYKLVYPEDKQPKFLTINVKRQRELSRNTDYHTNKELWKRVFTEYMGKDSIYYIPQNEEEWEQSYYGKGKWRHIGDSSITMRGKVQRFGDKAVFRKDPLVQIDMQDVAEKCMSYIKGGENIYIFDEYGSEERTETGTIATAKKYIEEATTNLNKQVKISFTPHDELKRMRDVGPWASRASNGGYSDLSDASRKFEPYVGDGTIRPRTKEERQIVRENIEYLKQVGRTINKRIQAYREKKKQESQ